MRARKLVALSWVAVCATVVAQEPRPASAEGVVLNSTTLEPIAQAQVGFQQLLERTPGRTQPRVNGAVTDSAGRFRVEGLAPGEYRIMLRREGYGIPRSMFSALRVKLAPAEARSGLRFLMNSQGAVSGRVLDDVGEPVPGAIAQLTRRVTARGASSAIPGPAATTDDLGNFRVPAVDPGRYAVQAVDTESREVLFPEPGGGVTAYATTYAPSTTDPQQAELIEVRAGEEAAPVVIRMRREPVFPVRGRVLDAEGNPLTGAQIFLRSAAGFSFFAQPGHTRTMPDGRFEMLGVPRGEWILTAFPAQRRSEPRLALATQISVSQSPLEDVILRAAPPVRMTGTTALEGDAKPEWRSVNIVVRPAGEAFGLSSNAGRPREDGGFELTASGQGPARIDVVGRPAAGTYVASIQSGAVDLTRRTFSLDQGLPGPLRVVFRTGAARIQGQMENRKAATVLLWPAEPEARDPQPLARTETDATGAFNFAELAPGAYLLYAVPPEDPLALGPGTIPADLEQRGTRVKLEPGTTGTITLPLQEER